VVLGSGIAGLLAAQVLAKRKDFVVTLVSGQESFCFLPRLTEYLSGSVPERKVILPLAQAWKGERKAVRASAVNAEEKTVLLETGELVAYDTLIIAVGSETNTFNTPGANYAYAFYSKDDADRLREHLGNMLSADEASGIHTVTVVGGGPTGVEVAGVLADTVRAKRPNGKILLLDRAPKILGAVPELSEFVTKALERRGVEIRSGVAVNQITPMSLDVTDAAGTKETIPCYTTVWAAGSKPVRLAMAGVTLTERGEIPVEPTLAVRGIADCYAIGDVAAAGTPKTAQAAVQQAAHVVQNILSAKAGRPQKPFAFHYRGTVIALGNDTVGLFFGKRVSGFIARQMRDTYYSFMTGQYE
jgi:NADH dehydrogenase